MLACWPPAWVGLLYAVRRSAVVGLAVWLYAVRVLIVPLDDPDLQPLDRVVKVRLSDRQLGDIDLLCEEFSVSRSWFLREALAAGLPVAVANMRQLMADGFVPAGARNHPVASGPRRGPRSDGARSDRWVRPPAPTRAGRGRGRPR